MSTGPVPDQVKTAAGDTAGTALHESAQTARTAKDAAAQTASTAGQEVSHVAGQVQSAAADVVDTTKEQVADVAGEALDQVRDLTDQVRGQLSEQAGKAAAQLAQAVRSLAEELQQMSDHRGDTHGAASQAAHTLSGRAHKFADYLQGRDPEGVVSDLRHSAARRPGGFLFGAVVAGALAGRFVKGSRAAANDSTPTASPAAPTTPVSTTPVAPVVSQTPLGDASYESTAGLTGRSSAVSAVERSGSAPGSGDPARLLS